jgi:hypothetical protein
MEIAMVKMIGPKRPGVTSNQGHILNRFIDDRQNFAALIRIALDILEQS